MSIYKRYIIFIIALFIQSMGIALVVKSLLGTSPISSVPYVLCVAYPFSFGQFTFAMNMVFLLMQIIILGRRFSRLQLMQAPFVLLFSMFIDFGMYVLGSLVPENYLFKLAVLLIGASMVSLGVALQIIANVIVLSGEGIVRAIADNWKLDFGYTKTGFDTSLVIIAAVISYFSLGTIEGIREGTLISAVVTGIIARFYLRHLSRVDKRGQLELHFH